MELAENPTNVTTDRLYQGIPICMKVEPPLVDRTALSFYLGSYVFPVIFVIGVTGNVLNLAVLNSRGMKTKANCFLSAMAVVDLCFLLIMFVLNLVNYDIVTSSPEFIRFHYLTKMTFIALVNGFSSSSIWFAIIVTVERLVAIRTPLHARSFWKSWRMVLIVGCTLFFTFSLQLFYLFYLTPDSRPHCMKANRRVYFFHVIKEHENYLLCQYVRISLIVTPILQLTVPIVILIFLNSFLLFYLWLNRKSVSRLSTFSGQNSSSNNKEWKITTTVLIIVLTFLFFSFPSLIMYWLTTFNVIKNSPATRNLTSIANFLVTVNKALNFVLYCTSSASFRRRLLKLFKGRNQLSKRVTFLHSTLTNDDTRNFHRSLTRMGEECKDTVVTVTDGCQETKSLL